MKRSWKKWLRRLMWSWNCPAPQGPILGNLLEQRMQPSRISTQMCSFLTCNSAICFVALAQQHFACLMFPFFYSAHDSPLDGMA